MNSKTSKGIATVALMILIPIACIIASYAAARMFGADSAITKDVEECAEEIVEDDLHVPHGSLRDKLSKIMPHNQT